jgi:hypothetical protein
LHAEGILRAIGALRGEATLRGEAAFAFFKKFVSFIHDYIK